MIDLPLHSICKLLICLSHLYILDMMDRYDTSDDGYIDQKELAKMIGAMVKSSGAFSSLEKMHLLSSSMILLVKLIVKVIVSRKSVQRKSLLNSMLAEIKN